jgi:hypothetical protein
MPAVLWLTAGISYFLITTNGSSHDRSYTFNFLFLKKKLSFASPKPRSLPSSLWRNLPRDPNPSLSWPSSMFRQYVSLSCRSSWSFPSFQNYAVLSSLPSKLVRSELAVTARHPRRFSTVELSSFLHQVRHFEVSSQSFNHSFHFHFYGFAFAFSNLISPTRSCVVVVLWEAMRHA